MPSNRILIIDPTVLLDTYADLGTRGLEMLLERGGRLFVSEEMLGEIRSQRQTAIIEWLDGLDFYFRPKN